LNVRTTGAGDVGARRHGAYARSARSPFVNSTIAEHDGRLLARIEDDHMVFEVNFDTLDPTDVTLHFLRDGEKVGSIYNDYGTQKTMARLTVPGDADFIGVEVPKSFVAELLDAAAETGRLADPTAAESYRLRVL
jgi:hypothetical protein